LTKQELHKWELSPRHSKKIFPSPSVGEGQGVRYYQNFYSLNKKNIKSRLQNEKASKPKVELAQKVASKLKHIPTIRFVGITGSLAMNNAGKGSDIDLMLITSPNMLWTTRIITFFYLKLLGFKLRRAGEREVSDALCLNIWLDTTSLAIPNKKRNIYTAHEIAQIEPLVNKNSTHEALIVDNSWIKDYWPNSLEFKKIKKSKKPTTYPQIKLWPIEELAYRLQLHHMRGKRTREQVGKHKAFFHPKDWSKEVKRKLLAP
jgi:predicted nucleotidyltransferase